LSSFIGVTLRLENQDIIDRVTAPTVLQPVARVDLYNASAKTAVEITSVKSFSIKRSLSGDSFSLVIGDATEWNERASGHTDLLSGQKKYWLKFYIGYKIAGTDYLYPYFTGLPTLVAEDYGPSSEAITVTGYGLDYLLSLIDGSVSAQTEDISTIIQDFIDASDLEGSFVSLPAKALIDEDINNDQAAHTIDYLMGAFPNSVIERYVDNLGNLIIHEKQNSAAEFSYDGEIVMVLSRTMNTQNLFTVCTVTGSPLRKAVYKIYTAYYWDDLEMIYYDYIYIDIYNHGFETGDLITMGGWAGEYSYLNCSGLYVTNINSNRISVPLQLTQPDIISVTPSCAWVVGASDSISAEVEDATGYLTNYGRRVKSISNKFVNLSADAATLAGTIITDSINRMQQVRIKVPFNPYLRPGSIISVTENDRSLTSDKIYCEDITAVYSPGQESAQTISGHILPA